MRIIAGSRRGRKLVDWEESGIRPMRDFVRSALYSILGDFLPDAAFLDLYCGTGSVGLEALSRGARTCVFVDRSPGACRIVRRNLDALDFLESSQVIEGDAVRVIDELVRRARRFDLVFIGPPYHRDLVPPTLDALSDLRLLGDDPVVVAEIHRNERVAERFGGLTQVDLRRYGDNHLLFFRPERVATEDESEP